MRHLGGLHGQCAVGEVGLDHVLIRIAITVSFIMVRVAIGAHDIWSSVVRGCVVARSASRGEQARRDHRDPQVSHGRRRLTRARAVTSVIRITGSVGRHSRLPAAVDRHQPSGGGGGGGGSGCWAQLPRSSSSGYHRPWDCTYRHSCSVRSHSTTGEPRASVTAPGVPEPNSALPSAGGGQVSPGSQSSESRRHRRRSRSKAHRSLRQPRPVRVFQRVARLLQWRVVSPEGHDEARQVIGVIEEIVPLYGEWPHREEVRDPWRHVQPERRQVPGEPSDAQVLRDAEA